MSSHSIFGTLLIAAGAIAGCKSDRPGAEAVTPAVLASRSQTPAVSSNAVSAPTTVTVTATDFALDLPAQIPAGVVTFHLVNRGKELHQTQLVKLENGKTVDDFMQAMKQPGPPPSWIKFMGGPNGIAPGQATTAASLLTPGHYVAFCIIPSPDGTPHLMKGMLRPFEVTGDINAAARDSLPAAGLTIRLADYTFEPSQPLTSGHHTVLVENLGPQPHELVLLRLSPGESVNAFGKWAESMKGPPPAMPLGGVAVLDKGGRGTFAVDLTPGDYGFICFVPDAKDGKPHYVHAMVKQIKVS